MGFTLKLEKGNIILAEDEKRAVEHLMRQTARSSDKAEMQMLGQELVQPIRTIAEYMEWGNKLLAPLPLGLRDDPMIPIENYDVQAFYTAVDGQIYFTRVGYDYARFETFMVDCGLEISWDELDTAPFDILGQKMKRAAEELARKRDSRVQAALEAAASSLSGHADSVSSAMTKAAVDAIFKKSAGIGLPIKNVAVNSGTVLDMRGWDSSTFQWRPPLQEKILLDGYLGTYGGANWFATYTVPSNMVYFCADPMNIGYFITRGDLRSASDINIVNKTNLYTYDQRFGTYVGNPYAVYTLQIN